MVKPVILLALILLFLVFTITLYYDTNTIEVKHYQISASPLARVLSGVKVAHLSDLHIKDIGLREKKILELLKEEKPDLILVTGDLISFKQPYESVLAFFKQLRAPMGVYGVPGNTEYSNENGSCILCHEERSSRLKKSPHPVLLRNSLILLNNDGKTFDLIGVDDPVGKKHNLKTALKEWNQKIPSILLAHSPEIFEEASGSGIDLVLSGHTHGGQLFVTKYLRKIFPLEASLEFLDGFSQKGKTLMYVSRGVGTSFLPFRWGVKPEITFFSFLDNPTNPNHLSREMRSQFHWDSITPTNSTTVFLGFSLTTLIETFTIRQFGNLFDAKNSGSLFFDFESDSELERLNWECHKWFERSPSHATSGKYSLRVVLPPGQYPGITFRETPTDWSKSNFFEMDVFNPSQERVNFHIRIDDHKSGWEYANRFDVNVKLKPGMNPISIPTQSIRTNLDRRLLNLKKIERMMVFIPNNTQTRELYIDHIRIK